ncbi:helix-turn-helix domain-containing protein [Rhodobacteraceae bacterium KMM 6894]|nr:helix-turn-helix domain-containing protein [Rhodobacteraceae bacterium KMM 6894]
MLAYVLATETLRLANKSAGKQAFSWHALTATNTDVRASSGALSSPDTTEWAESTSPDLILLCAGYHPLEQITPRLRAYLARARHSGATIGGVDTGTVILAHLGLLDGYRAVLHYEAEPEFRRNWPDISVSDQIYCLDRKRLTAAGGTATGDAMLAWITREVGKDLATATAIGMSHGMIRNADEPQRLQSTADPVLLHMDTLMREHLTLPLGLVYLSGQLGVSPKQLRRRCLLSYGQTPSAYYLKLRLDEAYRLLTSTHTTISDIALNTGFESLSGFSRAFKQRFQVAPSRIRQH